MNRYLYKNKMNICMYFIIAIVTYIAVTFIYKMYGIITTIIDDRDYRGAKNVILMSIIVLITLLVTLIANSFINRCILNNISIELRKDILDKVYSLEYEQYSKKSSSYYVSMIVNDVDLLETSYFANIIEFISDSIQLIVMLFAISLIGWQYTIIICIFSVFTVVQPYVLKRKLAFAGDKQSSQLEKYTSNTNELINGFSVIKGVGKDSIFKSLFGNSSLNLENAKNNLLNIKATSALLSLISVNILRVGGQLFFAYSSVNKIIVASTVAVLMGLINNISNPISQLLSYIEPINSTSEIRKKILNFLDEDTKNDNREKHIGDFEQLEVKNLSFAYSDSDDKVLKNISLTFEKGKKYALLGESGCGKSTVLKVLMGYYDNYEGNISFNGKEIKNIDKDSIRKKISYISQNNFVIDDNLFNNLTLGNKEYKNDQLEQVIYDTGLQQVVGNYKESSNVKNLSGGEKQRIGVARALLKKSNIIFMDEGTSALDSVTASIIEKNILLDKDRTLVAVLHKFNETIKMYDVIYYIKDGYVKEAGSYIELMNLRGDFYKNIIGGENN